MQKLLCLLCILVMLPVSCFAYTSDDGSPLAFDFDFGFEMDPDAFPTAEHRIAQGYSELLNRTRISGSYVLAGDGSDRYDLKLDLSVKDKKTETISFHFFGTNDYDLYLISPLLGNEMLYMRLDLWLAVALKVYDYFEIPLQELVLLVPYITEHGTSNLKNLWKERFPDEGITNMVANEVIGLAEDLQELLYEDENFHDWLKAIGIRSGFNSIIEEEMETLKDYVINHFSNGLTRTVTETGETWMTGEMVIASRTAENGTESFELLLPATEQYKLVTEISSKAQPAGTGKDLDLSAKIASEEESWLDLTVTGKNVPDSCFFSEPFTLDIKATGYLTGENDLKIVGEIIEDNRFVISVFLKDNSTSEYRQAIRVFGTAESNPDYSNPPYDLSKDYEWVYLAGLSEGSLSELLNNVAKPFAKGILPFLAQVPTITCQVILDQLTEHGVLNLLFGDLNLEK